MTDPKHRLTAADFDPEVLKLFDLYVHGLLDRRGFLDRAGRYAAASGMTAVGLLAALSPNFAAAQQTVYARAKENGLAALGEWEA